MKYTVEEIIAILEKQFKRLYQYYDLECIEFEYEEDGELYFNLLTSGPMGGNYVVKVNPQTELVYWDKDLD